MPVPIEALAGGVLIFGRIGKNRHWAAAKGRATHKERGKRTESKSTQHLFLIGEVLPR